MQPASTQSPEHAARRQEIVRQAAPLFRERGFHGTGMRDVAAALGVAPGALYYYFQGKDDLIYACQEIALSRLLEVGERLAHDAGDPGARLRELIRAHLALTLDELGGSAAHVEFHALPPELLRDIVAKRDAYEAQVRAILEDGVRRGAWPGVDTKLATLNLLGALNWTVVWWRPGGRLETGALAEGLADLHLASLRGMRAGTEDRPT